MAEATASFAQAPEIPPVIAERKTFRSELKPARARAKEADEFRRLLGQYEISINTAGDQTLNRTEEDDVVASADSVVKMRALKKRSADQGQPTKSEDEAIKISAKKVGKWFEQNFPGTHSLLMSYVENDPQIKAALDEAIGINLSHRIALRKLGAATRQELDKIYLEETARFIIDHSPKFKDLAATVGKTDTVLETSEGIGTASLVDEETLSLDRNVEGFALKDWIATNSQEARTQGRKIYETPYYSHLLREIHFLGRTKNGIGGVVLYGPPGTGKTELLIEKNRQEGFKTRLISVHHYISFGELIAEKAIQVGVDKGADLGAKIKGVLEIYGNMSPEDFQRDFSAMVDVLKKDGKLGPDETPEQFISSLVSSETAQTLGEKFDWKMAQEDFLRTQRARVLRTALPGEYGEITEELIRGEILLAIKNGERAVLDELDKAGPNSLGGLLTFLAESPGEEVKYGNAQVTIPSWFKVDGTSNKTTLDDFLQNRFSGMEIDVPPAKDQLMIAAVKVADHQGNILLSTYEQAQMAGFFIYLAPEINKVLKADGSPPLSNRDIQHLTSSLVDFDNSKRTDKSFGDAVRRLISERSVIAKSQSTPKKLEELLTRFPGILGSKAVDYKEVFSKLNKGSIKGSEILEATVDSPVIGAINGLESNPIENGSPKVKGVVLSDKQMERIKQFIIEQATKSSARADKVLLPTGFLLEKKSGPDGKSIISVTAVPSNDKSVVLATDYVELDGKIVASSADGKTVSIFSEEKKDRASNLTSYELFRAGEASDLDGGIQGGSGNIEAKMDAMGGNRAWLDKKNNQVNLGGQLSKGIKDFGVSKDGRTIVVEKTNGSSAILTTKLSPLVENLPGGGWAFVGDKLLVQIVNGVPQNQAFVIT